VSVFADLSPSLSTLHGPTKEQVAALQGAYFLATGVWPLVSRKSFEEVTGPKSDFWLARTVGVLVASVGGVLLLGSRRKRVGLELQVLGVATAAGLAAIDVIFALRGRISTVYLVDAVIEAAVIASWGRARPST
jgi:hypothetical protein